MKVDGLYSVTIFVYAMYSWNKSPLTALQNCDNVTPLDIFGSQWFRLSKFFFLLSLNSVLPVPFQMTQGHFQSCFSPSIVAGSLQSRSRKEPKR